MANESRRTNERDTSRIETTHTSAIIFTQVDIYETRRLKLGFVILSLFFSWDTFIGAVGELTKLPYVKVTDAG